MRFVPVPGFGIPTHQIPILDPDRNLAAWLDRGFNAFTRTWLHTGNLYNHTRDPEGLLSTLPAIATTLIGCLTGLWLVRRASGAPRSAAPSPTVGLPVPAIQTLRILILCGLVSLAFGLLWSHTFPLNKNLWTSSYVLFSAGWSLLLLALCYWLIDIRRMNDHPAGKWLLRPWLIFGSNAITAFVISNFIVELMLWIKVPAGPSARISSWLWAYRHLFARYNSTNVTSLAFAIAFTALCFLPNLFLWRKKIFLKV
jgi:predicted acyltransferase